MDKNITILKVSFDMKQAEANLIEALKNMSMSFIKLETADAANIKKKEPQNNEAQILSGITSEGITAESISAPQVNVSQSDSVDIKELGEQIRSLLSKQSL